MINKYKLSHYNYFINYNEDKVLLFNGLSGVGFCMTKKEHRNLQSLLKNLLLFKKQYPSDFTNLQELGCIIDADFSEIEFLKLRNKISVYNNNYSLIINPTLECNFNCWYCYEKHPQGKMSLSTIKKNNVEFLCSITTNAYLVNKEMIPLLNEIELTDYQITLDGSKERHDKIRNANGDPSYDLIISNINLLSKEIINSKINIRINYDHKTLLSDSVFNILDDIFPENRHRITINMQRVWQSSTSDNSCRNERMILFMKKANDMGFKMAYYGGGLTIGRCFNCYTSLFNQAHINFDGKIYKCTARDYSDKNNEMGLLDKNGSIIWDSKKLISYLKTTTFDNDTCLKCSYLPLCLGECPQHIYEMKSSQPIDCKMMSREISFEEEIVNYYNKTFFQEEHCLTQ